MHYKNTLQLNMLKKYTNIAKTSAKTISDQPANTQVDVNYALFCDIDYKC